MPDVDGNALGSLIRDLREALGYSQGRLAAVLGELSGSDTLTREYVSRWERGQRRPSRYWLPHLASALRVPLRTLEAENVRRRAFLRLAAASPLVHIPDTAAELLASIASGDPGPLTDVQTTHHTDLAVSRLVSEDRRSLLHLARWMTDGDTPVLRVNAAGILAKTHGDLLDEVALALGRDDDARGRYLWALTRRVGDSVAALAGEVRNPRDAGARWCAASLLGQDGSPAARAARTDARHREPVRENVRAIGLILSGANPCT
jgi:transcriptional regulator with XRE-family HTH domain